MKVKYLFGALLMAVLGAAIALFAYTKISDKQAAGVAKDSSAIEAPLAHPMLTSFEMAEGQIDFTYAAEQTVHAVVHVHVVEKVEQPDNPIMQFFYGDGYRNSPREVSGYGSGVIISPDGYIVTNNHVIEDADNIEVKLNDNRIFKVEVVGRDQSTDIALLKIKADNLSYLKYGDSEKLKVGEWVLAVGNPFNLTSTVTAGIVSAKGRNLQLINSSYGIESYIQTDAALNPGNSGGALVDTKGQLVGITSAILSRSGDYSGYSFAVPVSIVSKVVDDIRKYGTVQRALIGIQMNEVTPEDADKQNLTAVKGVIIKKIIEGGAAEEADLKENDIITKLDGISIDSPSELQEQVGKHRPGDKVLVTYFRNGKENTATITMKNVAGNTSVVTKGMGIDELYGARLETLSTSEKRMYNTDHGVKIVDISDGKFKDWGLKKGTIIMSVNGKKVDNSDDIRRVTNNENSLRTIEGYQPDGTHFSVQYGN
jgi:periplasmic serine protease, Do/DeqQ family